MDQDYDIASVKEWLLTNHIAVLNIAGPRASKFPDIYDQAQKFLKNLLSKSTGLAENGYPPCRPG